MKICRYILVLILAVLTGCHKYEQWDANAVDNFECLWQTVDEHYCFFYEKDVDWQEVHDRYKGKLYQRLNEGDLTVLEYYDLCADMLCELKDGHTSLISGFDIASYDKWWTDYPQDFNLRVVQQYYLHFDYRVTSGMIYQILQPSGIGYLYYPSFSNRPGEGNLDYVMDYLRDCPALIIDVRDNGGGEMTNINRLVARFISQPVIGGYIMHKTGPGHSDFSEPYPIEYKPTDATHRRWGEKPVVVLTNRSCYSAANDFVSVMKQLPNVRIVGARTGGGGGMPFSAELPMGWTVRFSACPVTDAGGNSIETGIDPSPGCEMHCTPEGLSQGRDAILDHAIKILSLHSNNKKTN